MMINEPEVVRISFNRNPNLKHLLLSILTLKKHRSIKFQGIGRATETVDIYIERFVKFDIGEVTQITTFPDVDLFGRKV